MRKIYIFILLIYLINLPTFASTLQGGIDYDGVYIDYQDLSYSEWNKKASNYLMLARSSKNISEQQKYYSQAVGTYQTMIKINPFDSTIMGTIGHIYGKMNNPVYAKAFLDRGLNLNIKNPVVHYYYGVFRQDERDYRKARKSFNYAYKYGYRNYDITIRLAQINAKLGELENAKFYYQKAYNMKPSDDLKNKILLLDDLKK